MFCISQLLCGVSLVLWVSHHFDFPFGWLWWGKWVQFEIILLRNLDSKYSGLHFWSNITLLPGNFFKHSFSYLSFPVHNLDNLIISILKYIYAMLQAIELEKRRNEANKQNPRGLNTAASFGVYQRSGRSMKYKSLNTTPPKKKKNPHTENPPPKTKAGKKRKEKKRSKSVRKQ